MTKNETMKCPECGGKMEKGDYLAGGYGASTSLGMVISAATK
jgi:hypothetical protein